MIKVVTKVLFFHFLRVPFSNPGLDPKPSEKQWGNCVPSACVEGSRWTCSMPFRRHNHTVLPSISLQHQSHYLIKGGWMIKHRSAGRDWIWEAENSCSESCTQEPRAAGALCLAYRCPSGRQVRVPRTAGWKQTVISGPAEMALQQSADTATTASQTRNSSSIEIFFSAWKFFMMWSVAIR